MFKQSLCRVVVNNVPIIGRLGQQLIQYNQQKQQPLTIHSTTTTRPLRELFTPRRRQFSTLPASEASSEQSFASSPPQHPQEPIIGRRQQQPQFQSHIQQRFALNSSKTYETSASARLKVSLFGNFSKDPSKVLTLVFIAAVVMDITVTNLLFSETLTAKILNFFETETIDIVADTKQVQDDIARLEVELVQKRLQNAFEGKSSLLSQGGVALENLLEKHPNAPLEPSIVGKLESRRTDWEQQFGQLMAQRLTHEGRLHPLKWREITRELWYGDLAQQGAIAGPNLMLLNDQDSSYTTTQMDLSPSPSSMDNEPNSPSSSLESPSDPTLPTPTPQQLNYAYYLYNTNRRIHADISHNAMLGLSDERLDNRVQILTTFPLLLNELNNYTTHYFKTYIGQYSDANRLDGYVSSRIDLWKTTNGINNATNQTTHNSLTPPCDLYEYYRGASGVITQGIDDYHTFHTRTDPTLFFQDNSPTALSAQLEPLEPYKWNSIALKGSLEPSQASLGEQSDAHKV